MLKKNKPSDMVKASLYMRKDEHAKIAALSGDVSLNLFVMRLVRKQIAALEGLEQKGLQGSDVYQAQDHPATATEDSGVDPKSNEK